MDRERAAVIMQRLYELERLEGWTLQQFFSGWFMGAPPETIRRGNLLDFTAYGRLQLSYLYVDAMCHDILFTWCSCMHQMLKSLVSFKQMLASYLSACTHQ